jgi:hypothetical protein
VICNYIGRLSFLGHPQGGIGYYFPTITQPPRTPKYMERSDLPYA